MSFVSPFLLIAALSLAAPAFSQDAPASEAPAAAVASTQTAPETAPEETAAAEEPISPEEAAFNERSAALGQRVLAVDEEMKSAARLAALDPVVAETALDDLQSGFQAEIDAFIQDFFNLAGEKYARLPAEEQEAFRNGVEHMAAQLSILPQSMRDRAEAAALLPPTAPTAPAAN